MKISGGMIVSHFAKIYILTSNLMPHVCRLPANMPPNLAEPTENESRQLSDLFGTT
jgi:hypothetical protein